MQSRDPQEIADEVVERFHAKADGDMSPHDRLLLVQEIATALGSFQMAVEGTNAQLVAALRKLKPGEPFFLVRGQDNLAADTVEWWAIHARMSGVRGDKVLGANQIADDMREWPGQKLAD